MYEDIISKFICNYVSLHLHTIKSINDGILKIDDYIEKAKKLKLPALSITNHGVMYDVYEFYSKCKENNIKPILGCEVYVTEDRMKKDTENASYYHLVLLAKNKEGFENLLKIHNDAQINGFYYKPRTDISILKKYGKGIIALSACVGGDVPRKILQAVKKIDADEDDEKAIIDRINLYKSIFDDFYLEIQPGDFADQIIVNNALIELSKITDTKLVVTNDVHYLNKEDYIAHNIHVCARKKNTVDKDNIYYPDKCYYVMTNEEIVNYLYKYIDMDTIVESVNNVYNIINDIEEYDLIPDKIYMPEIEIPAGFTEETYLLDICFKKLNNISNRLDDISVYTERLLYEFDTLKELHFCGYFLVVRDYLLWCDNNHIMRGPGRGSVVGSLIAYLMDITKVDPIRYNLLFERFLSIHRKNPPDIDSDIDASKRELLFEYVVNKYGKDRCCLVSTFTNRKSRLAVKDTGRAYGIPEEVFNAAAALIPTVYYIDTEDGNTEKQTDISIEEAIDLVPEFKEYADKYPDWINAAIKLSNIPKATSLHAAGTIISPVPLHDKMPLTRSSNENILATELNLEDAELIKFIKFDFLSLSTLGVIDNTLKFIGEKNLDFIGDAYDDENVWKIIGSSKTAGLFQIGTNTYRQRMSRLHPCSIEELAAVLALVRGPCISNKLDEKYMNILNGLEEVELIHPVYDSACEDTFGVLLYQEQLMQICNNIGFSIEDGYRIMKASAKKKFKVLKKYRKDFMKYAENLKMNKQVAERIFKMIVDSGLYSFNKSHAVAYAVLVYYTAYLKTYYPREFLAASLTNAYERKEETKDLISECRRLGFNFIAPDINKSSWGFTLEGENSIRIGFCAIRSFGYQAYEEVLNNKPFESMDDFLNRIVKKNCSKRAIIPAIFTGCFNSFYDNKLDAYNDYCQITKCNIDEELNIQGLKEKVDIYADDADFEKAFLNYPLISDPVNMFPHIGLSNIKFNERFDIKGIISRVKKIKDKNKNSMAFVTIETGDGTLEFAVFADKYKKFSEYLKKDLICDFNFTYKKNGYNLNSIIMAGI